jgi:Fe-S-cluster containining protein
MLDFSPYFKPYEDLVTSVDRVFAQVKNRFPECVSCGVGCSDCCYAIFDLSLVEAVYLNHQFNEKFKGRERERLLEKANEADRKLYRIKRKAYRDLQSGLTSEDIFSEVAQQRVRCPLLNDANQCDLYEVRPITCRFYGIPTAIGGKGHTCWKSGFKKGFSYPTVNLDLMHENLYRLSRQLVEGIGSRYAKISDLLVPVSMALLTDYDDQYLGVVQSVSEL